MAQERLLKPVAARTAQIRPTWQAGRKMLEAATKNANRPNAGKFIAGMRIFLKERWPTISVAVRVYAHQVRAGRKAGDRFDFTETLYWNAGVKTDENGKASVKFALNDSVTSFRTFADAFSANGAIGQSSLQIESVQPFYVEPKVPLEVTTGDDVRLPIGLG